MSFTWEETFLRSFQSKVPCGYVKEGGHLNVSDSCKEGGG